MRRGLATQVISIADDHCGGDQVKETKENQVHCFAAGAPPFMKENSQNRVENDDRRHVEGPAG